MTIDLMGGSDAAGMRLLLNADVYAPAHLGHRHLLTGGGRILWMGTERPALPAYLGVHEHDLQGQRMIPGLVDGHCHITGGGGEAGPAPCGSWCGGGIGWSGCCRHSRGMWRGCFGLRM